MGSDETDDEPLTELDVDVDPSALLEGNSEITITRAGASAITASLDTRLPAETEPSTLEPQLVVRGLGPSPLGSSASRPRPRASEADVYDGDDDEDKTKQSIEARLLQVYEHERAKSLDERVPRTTAPLDIMSLPSARRELVGLDEARTKLDQQAAAGGTVRMFFDPRTGKASAHPDTDASPLPVAPPVIVRAVPPSALVTAMVPRRSKPRTGRILFVFLVACGLTGSGVYHRARLVPWAKAQLLAIRK